MALQEEMERQGNWLFRYRGVLPIVILVIGLILYLRTELNPSTFFLEETPYEIYYEMFALLLALFGLAIRIYTVGYTPKNTSGRNVKCQLADQLNTTGIYSLVRHPLYLGNFFMWLGAALLTGNFWFVVSFILFYWVYYERIMFAEEQFLRRKFGDVYLTWASKVPAFFPNFKQFRKPAYPFSWKKVLRKEKNGLTALFLVFALFNVLGEWVEHQSEYNWPILICCLVTVVLYFVLRYFKRRTDLLNEPDR